MKKLTVLIALVAMCFAASAQQMHLQSAISYFNKKYLNKAKTEIDLAVTSDKNIDSKTWFYKAKIYITVGQYPTNPNGFKYKGEVPADWRDQAYNAALECKRLDTDNQWAEQNNALLNILGIEYSNAGIDLYNSGKYQEAFEIFENSIKMFNASGNSKNSNDSYYLAGLCSVALHDTTSIIKNFNTLVRKRTDKDVVYTTLFNIYKHQNKPEDAFKVANNYVKNCPKEYKAYILLANSYMFNKNMDKAKETLNSAEALTKDDPTVHATLLCAVGGILADAGEIDAAVEKYNESLKLYPGQFEANYGMGTMFYNRGVDKNAAASAIEPSQDSDFATIDKLTQESNENFAKSIPYFKAAVATIDAMPEGDAKVRQNANLYNCLTALKNAYVRVNNLEELKPINARLAQIEAQQGK